MADTERVSPALVRRLPVPPRELDGPPVAPPVAAACARSLAVVGIELSRGVAGERAVVPAPGGGPEHTMRRRQR